MITSTSLVTAKEKVAIVNQSDSALIYEYVAVTIFNNSENRLPCDFNPATYAEKVVVSGLREKYEVSKIDLPSYLAGYPGIQPFKKWIKSLNGQFDYVIVIQSHNWSDYAHNTNAILTGAGLYSRVGLSAEVYSTLSFTVYATIDGKPYMVDPMGFKRIKDYQFAEVKNNFNPEMCNYVVSELKGLINEDISESFKVAKLYSEDSLFVIFQCLSTQLQPQINIAMDTNLSDSSLVTGWYYINESGEGFERKLDKSDEIYFIDPKPIVTECNFRSVELYETNFRGTRPDYAGLIIRMDEDGRKSFALSTYKSYNKRLAFIVNNKLVYAPMIMTIVTDGITNIRRFEYNMNDVNSLKEEIHIPETKR